MSPSHPDLGLATIPRALRAAVPGEEVQLSTSEICALFVLALFYVFSHVNHVEADINSVRIQVKAGKNKHILCLPIYKEC